MGSGSPPTGHRFAPDGGDFFWEQQISRDEMGLGLLDWPRLMGKVRGQFFDGEVIFFYSPIRANRPSQIDRYGVDDGDAFS